MTDSDAPRLDAGRRRELLVLARSAIAARLARREPPTVPPARERPRCGVFVSLHTRVTGALRGCVGSVDGTGPLERAVGRLALESAFGDPRFPPLRPDELDGVAIEISVLGAAVEVAGPEQIEIGRHGAIVERHDARGLLLPQVAAQLGWDAPTLLAQVCRKAGLDPEAWRQPDTRILRFTAEVFAEDA